MINCCLSWINEFSPFTYIYINRDEVVSENIRAFWYSTNGFLFVKGNSKNEENLFVMELFLNIGLLLKQHTCQCQKIFCFRVNVSLSSIMFFKVKKHFYVIMYRFFKCYFCSYSPDEKDTFRLGNFWNVIVTWKSNKNWYFRYCVLYQLNRIQIELLNRLLILIILLKINLKWKYVY